MQRQVVLRVCLLALAAIAGAHAQAVSGAGGVSGTVRDPNGEEMPDAEVTVTNERLGIHRHVISTDDGVFDVQNLVPGDGYTLTVVRKGFATWETNPFRVDLGQTLNFKIILATATAAVTKVKAEAAVSKETDDRISIVQPVTREELAALPSAARRLDAMVLLSPAVVNYGPSGVIAARGEGTPQGFVTDGVNTSNLYFIERPGIAPALPQDAVEAVQVIPVVAPVEFSRTMNVSINAVTHSGSNDFHGTAYDFYSSPTFNAHDRYALGESLAGTSQQPGASLGGPIVRNKIFAFFNAEYLDTHAHALNRITNPLIADPTGTVVLSTNCKATATQCTAAEKFIQAQMDVVVPRVIMNTAGLAKVDYRRSDRTSFSVEGNVAHGSSPANNQEVSTNGGLLGFNGTTDEENRYAKAEWTRSLFTNAINQLRFAWYKDRIATLPDNQYFPSTGALGISIAGTQVGANPAYANRVSEQRYQIGDSFTVTAGSQSIKLGANMAKSTDWVYGVADAGASYYYSSLTNFAEDFTNTNNSKNYMYFAQGFGTPARTLKTTLIDPFGQDSWRITDRFTVSAGLGWEKARLPQPKDTNSTFYETCCITSSNTDFTPRVGVSYLLGKSTVLRLGFGFFYEPYAGQIVDALYLGNGIYQENVSVNPNQTGSLVFPKKIAVANSIPNGSLDLVYSAGKFHNPHMESGSFSIEHRFTNTTTVEAGFIDNTGMKLWTAVDTNLQTTATNKTYNIADASGAIVNSFTTPMWIAKTSNQFAHVYEVANSGTSWYKGAVFRVRQEMSHGLAAQASYTWSHALDDVGNTYTLPYAAVATVPGASRNDKGDSRFDQSQRAILSLVWEPKVNLGNSVIARYLVNGWQFSAIATLASPMPETETVVVTGQQFAGVTMPYTTSLNGSGGWATAPFDPIGTLDTGKIRTVDARVTRALPITDRIKASLAIEGYNLGNSQFNTSVFPIGYTAASGTLRPVAGLGMGTESYGFPYGTNARRLQLVLRITF